jgi:hypothetical protein
MPITLKQRVEVLEQRVEKLASSLPGQAQAGRDDWQKTFGASKDDPGFDDMNRLGRDIRRKSDRLGRPRARIISAKLIVGRWLGDGC